MFSRLCSDFASFSHGGGFSSFVVRAQGDGSFMALIKWTAADLKPMVVYGVADNPDKAVARCLDAIQKPERWRRDKLESRL